MKTLLLTPVLLFTLGLSPVVAVAGSGQAAVEPAMTLEQAVSEVQRDTGGKVLSATTVQRGRGGFEHRIKVLTPDGHVRVVSVTTEAEKRPSPETIKNPSSDGDSNKEKH